MPVLIRAARQADDRSLAALDAEVWPPELWVVPPQPTSEPFFGARRSPEDVLVAEEGDVLLGYARLGRHMPIEANAHVLHLYALAVSPAARGRRVGSALLDAAVAEARRRGARKLGLRALLTNGHAIALYLRHVICGTASRRRAVSGTRSGFPAAATLMTSGWR
ncbi:MAG: N-acetyltransferase family protein [Streptosporangiaceae bacterium]